MPFYERYTDAATLEAIRKTIPIARIGTAEECVASETLSAYVGRLSRLTAASSRREAPRPHGSPRAVGTLYPRYYESGRARRNIGAVTPKSTRTLPFARIDGYAPVTMKRNRIVAGAVIFARGG